MFESAELGHKIDKEVYKKAVPQLRADLHSIAQYLGEREREAHYCLKRFKQRTAERGDARPLEKGKS